MTTTTKKYKMLVSDLDGTIGNDEHKISEVNKKAMKELVEAGVIFVLCSGRTPVSLEYVLDQVGIQTDYIVGFNGCSIIDTKTRETLYEQKMDKTNVKDLIKTISDFDVTIGVYMKDNLVYAQREKGLMDRVDRTSPIHYEIHEDLGSEIKEDIHKIILVADRDELDKVYAKMEPIVKDKCGMVFTNTNLLEFIPLNGNKGIGLKILAERLNIPLSQIVSCGDNYNDIELIETAGLGIAVANAVEPLKKVADKITKNTNNQGGFAEIVEFIIKENKGGLN